MRRLIAVLLLLGALPARADDAADAFTRAAADYDAGRFQAAAQLYDSLLERGYRNATVYFNLGNASFRAGDIGRAVWAYRAGQRLAPRDPDIEANLTVARLAARDRIETVPPGFFRQTWRAVSGLLSLAEGARLVTVTWLLLWACAAAWLFLPRWRRWFAPPLRLIFTIWVAAALVLAARYLDTRNTRPAVVTATETEARSGPGDEFDTVFDGHAGLECIVRGRQNGYVLIELANGRVGWVPASDLALVPS